MKAREWGVYPYVLCDDIGLHIDAVSGYIDSIINEEVLLIKYYKTKRLILRETLRNTNGLLP